jgi:ATP-binding cassette subfamily B protein
MVRKRSPASLPISHKHREPGREKPGRKEVGRKELTIRAPRVPIILQRQTADCGAACLAMVLAAHGKQVQTEEIHRLMKLGPQGVDAHTLLKVAQRFGLRGRGVAVDLSALQQLPLPAILHWRNSHYVVLVAWRKKSAEIIDPSLGRTKLDARQFGAAFSGTALLFE